MNPFPSLAGHLTRIATAPVAGRFGDSLDEPERSQARVLRQIITDASRCELGRSRNLQPSDGLPEFREKVRLATYENYRPLMARAVFDGEPNVISPHRIVRVEATSGSTSGVKWIPYTPAMMKAFSRMFALWSHDILASGAYRPRSGQIFLCVTGGRPDDGTLPHRLIGDDRDYLGRRWRHFLKPFIVAPKFAAQENPLQKLAETLSSKPRLEVMSFWSPSLFLAILDHLGIDSPGQTKRLWPELQLISCWTAASSSTFARRLSSLFPSVRIQGKGLLATEAAMTIPWERAKGCVPLLEDVFLEFLGEDGRCFRLDQLIQGQSYEVVVSNLAGLLRYRIGDRIRVGGFYRGTPLLEFVGRAGVVSDLVGEKLTVEFVSDNLSSQISSYFCLLPLENGYKIWIDSPSAIESDSIDDLLRRNFHYDRARKLGQLKPIEVAFLPHLAEEIRLAIEGERVSSASRAFKPPLLVADGRRAFQINSLLSSKSR